MENLFLIILIFRDAFLREKIWEGCVATEVSSVYWNFAVILTVFYLKKQ